MSRFMFFIAGSGRILGGTQDTLEVLSESGEADMGDRNVSLGHIMDEATQEALMSAAETAFNKNNRQLMKFITVSPICHARGRRRTTQHMHPEGLGWAPSAGCVASTQGSVVWVSVHPADPLSERQQRVRDSVRRSLWEHDHGGGVPASDPVLGGRGAHASHGQGVLQVGL